MDQDSGTPPMGPDARLLDDGFLQALRDDLHLELLPGRGASLKLTNRFDALIAGGVPPRPHAGPDGTRRGTWSVVGAAADTLEIRVGASGGRPWTLRFTIEEPDLVSPLAASVPDDMREVMGLVPDLVFSRETP